jgi:hypothetical protein
VGSAAAEEQKIFKTYQKILDFYYLYLVKKSFLSILFIILAGFVFSQNYPVQTTIQLTPPYTSYLPDYTDGINSKLQVALNITDVNEPILQVKLKFTLEGPGGKIVTNPNFIQSPITLNFGEVLILSGDELSPYLAFDNLVFPSQTFEQNYRQTKVLPEGLWKLCVDVIDATNPSSELLSMNNCALIFVARLQPPMLNIPICETTLPRAQNIFFSWTDMALGSQAIGQEPLYDFSLYSVPLSAYNNPTQVLNTNPIFITTTTVASFSLDTNEVFLPAGQKYLWQVRAKLPDGSRAYLNNGYSAPCTFVFGDLAAEVIDDLSINLTAQGRGPTYGTASWTLSSASGSTQTFESYVISYRKAGNPYYGWYEDAVVGNQFDIKQLEDSTLYEVKIKGIIGESETEYTDIVTFRTLPYLSYACGDGNIRPLSPTYTPLANENAYAGIKVEQGQFFMEVTSIEPNGMGAGRFKGTGKIKVDFLFVSVKVSFDNLLIDSDYTARAGVVNVITQGLDEWLNAGYLNQVTPIVVSGTITDGVFTNDTTVVVTTTDGTHTFVFENDLPIVVHGDGNVEYQFWPDGTIVITTFGITLSADNLDASAQRNIRFKASPNQEYGFDGLEYAAWKNKYEVIICSDQFQYVVPHKSMSQQASDVVYAVLKGNIPKSDVTFKLKGGTLPLEHIEVDDSTFAITLPAKSFSYAIYAYFGLEKLGKLNVESYEVKTKKVRIVPISNVALNASQITNSLNKTYKDANINFDVSIAAPYTSTLFTSQTLFTNPNTTLLAKYTEQMRQLRDEYLATNSLENDEYLLFSIAGFQDQSIDGYMVRGRALGFIKATTDTSQLFTTIAHELGHGIGGLRHSWDDQGPTQASTNNLMDYAGGRKLIKEQCEKMRDPGLVIVLLDSEEDFLVIGDGLKTVLRTIFTSYQLASSNDPSYTNFLNISGEFENIIRQFVKNINDERNSFNELIQGQIPAGEFGNILLNFSFVQNLPANTTGRTTNTRILYQGTDFTLLNTNNIILNPDNSVNFNPKLFSIQVDVLQPPLLANVAAAMQANGTATTMGNVIGVPLAQNLIGLFDEVGKHLTATGRLLSTFIIPKIQANQIPATYLTQIQNLVTNYQTQTQTFFTTRNFINFNAFSNFAETKQYAKMVYGLKRILIDTRYHLKTDNDKGDFHHPLYMEINFIPEARNLLQNQMTDMMFWNQILNPLYGIGTYRLNQNEIFDINNQIAPNKAFIIYPEPVDNALFTIKYFLNYFIVGEFYTELNRLNATFINP